MKNVYMYYLSKDEDLSRLLVSYSSLKSTNTHNEIYCLVSSQVSERVRDFLLQINLIPLDGTMFEKYSQDNNIKEGELLEIIYYTQFDKILYLSLDTYILKNIDEVFNHLYGSTNLNMCDHIGIQLHNNLSNYANIQDVFNKSVEGITSMKDWTLKNIKLADRKKVQLSYLYTTNILDISDLLNNELFNISELKIIHTYLENNDITKLKDLYEFNNTVQTYLYDYLKQYNLIIGVFKQLYPEMSDLLYFAELKV